jgi:D-amino-acid oxidase
VVHNYGHGGAGWSLSWAAAEIAAGQALAGGGVSSVAVIGAGAMGLTTAFALAQAGARVTIYARELPAESRSARATGALSPDSRIALADRAPAGFPALWEMMARRSYATHNAYVGLAGAPVEWVDRYTLYDTASPTRPAPAPGLDFASLNGRLAGLVPSARTLEPGEHPFVAGSARKGVSMIFNVAEYALRVMIDFLAAGGRIERRTFPDAQAILARREPVIVNCTGMEAKTLWGDESLVPVRGQIAWLAPEPAARYAVYYRDVTVLSRRDGVVVQYRGPNDGFGYGVADETPDREEFLRALDAVRPAFARLI